MQMRFFVTGLCPTHVELRTGYFAEMICRTYYETFPNNYIETENNSQSQYRKNMIDSQLSNVARFILCVEMWREKLWREK